MRSKRIHHTEHYSCKIINDDVVLVGTALAHFRNRELNEPDKICFNDPHSCTGQEKCGREFSKCEIIN